MAVKTDDFSDTEQKLSRVCQELERPAGSEEETVARKITT